VIIPTLLAAAQIAFPTKAVKPAEAKAEIVYLDKVWARAGHSAFTDLIRFRERWFLAFREASTHVSGDGAIRILTSFDFQDWQDLARITHPGGDLRDPKLCETPDGQIMLTTALARSGNPPKRSTNPTSGSRAMGATGASRRPSATRTFGSGACNGIAATHWRWGTARATNASFAPT
jgi:hypothetical protein